MVSQGSGTSCFSPSEMRSLSLIELQDLDGDLVAGITTSDGMIDAAVRHVADVQQASMPPDR